MTDIDPKSEIELHTVNEHVIVRVPLAGPMTDEWLRRQLGALAVAITVPLLLPARFSLGPKWIVPAVLALLLAAIVVADRARDDRRPAVVRALSLALMAEVLLGVNAAGKSLEQVTKPLTSTDQTTPATQAASVPAAQNTINVGVAGGVPAGDFDLFAGIWTGDGQFHPFRVMEPALVRGGMVS